MKLRAYQERLVEGVFDKWRTFRSTLIVAATGCGKTVIFAEIIRRSMPGRALVLAHRNELIVQAREKIEALGIPCEIEKANLYASTNLFHATPVVVSSIQTQCSGPKDKRRYTRFNPDDFSILICDEAHHATAPSWAETIDYYKRNPRLKVLGVTATPDRSDSGVGPVFELFESQAGKYEMLDAIQDGYLVRVTQQFVTVQGLDYSHIKTTAGDLNEGDLSRVLILEDNVQRICQPVLEAMHALLPQTLDEVSVPEWKQYLASLPGVTPRRTIIFAVSVIQAEIYCDVLSRAMNGVEWVCGATRPEERALILDRFACGQTHAVVNCGVLTEGFDNPGVEMIVMARPTKSRVLYAQMVGRSTRPLPGLVDDPALDTPEKRRQAIRGSLKPYCRILDFVGNSGKHTLVTCLDILGGRMSPAAVAKARRKAEREGKPVLVMEAMTNAEIEIEKEKRAAAERSRLAEAARKQHLLARAQYESQEVNPFGNTSFNYDSGRNRGKRQFSEKQRIFLRKWCGRDPATLNYWQGTSLIAAKMAEWEKRKKSA